MEEKLRKLEKERDDLQRKSAEVGRRLWSSQPLDGNLVPSIAIFYHNSNTIRRKLAVDIGSGYSFFGRDFLFLTVEDGCSEIFCVFFPSTFSDFIEASRRKNQAVFSARKWFLGSKKKWFNIIDKKFKSAAFSVREDVICISTVGGKDTSIFLKGQIAWELPVLFWHIFHRLTQFNIH